MVALDPGGNGSRSIPGPAGASLGTGSPPLGQWVRRDANPEPAGRVPLGPTEMDVESQGSKGPLSPLGQTLGPPQPLSIQRVLSTAACQGLTR